MPPAASARLNAALHRLSRNPQSVPALLEAGRASIELGDVDAAEGFFLRARNVDDASGAAIAGLAIVALKREEPLQALDLFAQAAEAGEDLAPYASDHGFAYDLIGENETAQALYGIALSRDENAVTIRRLSLSYAIAGDRAASEAILLPLLQRRDLAAYRTRAFALAILGDSEEAVSIAETMLPARLARRMAPYLRYMPRLTKAQQAAAANLGSFPRAADIGRDDVELTRRTAPPPASVASTAGSRLVPTGEPLGEAARPSISLEDMPQEDDHDHSHEDAETLPAPASLNEAFADFSLEAEDNAQGPAPGAVDITSFEPVREAPPEPAPPAHPSRHWVQVATGQNVSAFRFDWRRIQRNASGLLDDMEPHRARWNRTNRLVTGPFDSANEAQELVTALRAEGVRTFRWTSAEGERVTPIN